MVAVKEQQAALGMGLYTPQEAAQFAKLRTETFNRWFYGDRRGEAVLQPRVPPTEEQRIVTFWDLMQAVAVRTLRSSPKASRLQLSHIRTIVAECTGRGITFPLARRHTLYCFGNRLILLTEDDQYIGLEPGIDKDQLYHGKIIEPFLQEVSFGNDKMARVWTPLQSAKYKISLDAERRFGMPVVEPGGVLVSALADAVESEGAIEHAAEAFEVETEAVRLALKYHEYLLSAA